MSTVLTQLPRSQLFTCLACQVAFDFAHEQRNHYGTDWHRYNLKRKVVELPPVTVEDYEQKLLAQQAQSNDAPFSAECAACNKTYYSKNAYANHLRSNKHKVAENKAMQEGNVQARKVQANVHKNGESGQDEENDALLTDTDCLFCTQKSESFEANMTHMTKAHSFFIPEIEFLVDLRGLIKYLGEKIAVENVCLHCNGRGKGLKSLEAVRQHMMDKGHCMIAYDKDDDMMEIVDFYDFTSSYPAEEDSEGWEHVDDDEWDDVDETANGEDTLPKNSLIYEDGTELVLPSGARIGHRSLHRYYRQNLRPEENRDSVIINRLITQYGNDFGYIRHSGCIFVTSGGKSRRMQSRIAAFHDKIRYQEFDLRIGVKANKLQRHFRAQIL